MSRSDRSGYVVVVPIVSQSRMLLSSLFGDAYLWMASALLQQLMVRFVGGAYQCTATASVVYGAIDTIWHPIYLASEGSCSRNSMMKDPLKYDRGPLVTCRGFSKSKESITVSHSCCSLLVAVNTLSKCRAATLYYICMDCMLSCYRGELDAARGSRRP